MGSARHITTVVVLLVQVAMVLLGGAGARACFSCDVTPSPSIESSQDSCCCADDVACPCCDVAHPTSQPAKESDCPSVIQLPAVVGEGMRIQPTQDACVAIMPEPAPMTLLRTPSQLSVYPPKVVIDTGPPLEDCGLSNVVMLV